MIRIASANLFFGNHAPAHGVRGIVREVRPRRPPDSIGIQEGFDHLPQLNTLNGYQTVGCKATDPRLDRANPILVNTRYDVTGQDFIAAAAGVPGIANAHSRNIVVATYTKQGVPVAHVNTHLHVVKEEALAVAAPDKVKGPGAQYRDHVLRLLELLEQLRGDGFVVFVTADGNTRPRRGVPNWEFALYQALANAGLRMHRKGVDLVAFDPGRVRLVGHRIIPTAVTGSDEHDAIVIFTEVISS